jgi:hypothetical protein
MQFRRKKKRGVNRKVMRTWLSPEGYRITWRREAFGIRLPARFKACVRVLIPNYSGEHGEFWEMWDFLNKPKLYKTIKTAQEDCERHEKLWLQACEAAGVRGLLDLFGKIPVVIPCWARKKLNRKVLAILLAPNTGSREEEDDDECQENTPLAGGAPSPSGPTVTSPTSGPSISPTLTQPVSGLVLPAEDGDGNTTRKTRRARSKATSTGEPSDALSAAEAAKEPERKRRKRTEPSSTHTKRKSVSTKASAASAKQRSRDSRPRKSKHSGS